MTTAAQRMEQTEKSKNQVNEVVASLSGSPSESEQPLSLQEQELNNSGDTPKSFTDEVSKKNEQKYQYAHLNDAVSDTEQEDTEKASAGKVSEPETKTENDTETEPESTENIVMCDDDSMMLAGIGVMTANSALPSFFKAPVSIPEDKQEALASKLAPLIKKYYSGGEMPAWLKKYQKELEFGLALGGALFGCWQQARAFKADTYKPDPVVGPETTSDNEEIKPEFSYDYGKAA